MKYIIGISTEHNATVSILRNGKVIYSLEEERLNRFKYEGTAFLTLLKAKEYIKNINAIVISGIKNQKIITENKYGENLTFLELISKRLYKNCKIFNFSNEHHLTHAAGSFYNSGFDKAISLVFDGAGSLKDNRFHESYSSYLCKYPNKFESIEKEYFDMHSAYSEKNKISLGYLFHIITTHLGLGDHRHSGKTMGLSAYGKKTNVNIYDILDPFLMKPYTQNQICSSSKNLKNFNSAANLAYAIQKYCENFVLKKVLNSIKKTGCKNICLSGGFILNCVNNYNLIKKLPKNINVYIEPLAHDSGTAIGAAKYLYYKKTNSYLKNKQTKIYYGPRYKNYNLKNCNTSNTSFVEVAKLLANNKIVAIYQGRSEQGPRALGNRSILFNPSNKKGKDIINKIKKRESFRPFAGTILHEYANKYFEMLNIKESPFMMYAIKVKKNKIKEIPAIVHVDNTCRIQTLKKNFNLNFYNLIYEFFKITNIPILLNTSFNLNDEPIVETIEDALKTFYSSDIDYLYLPEKQILITKNG